MDRAGKAIAYGAVTVVNALSCGMGAALGVKLWTEATVRLTDNVGKIRGRIVSDPNESTKLIEKTVKCTLKHLNLENTYGATVETESNIPIARGLKSSSAAANAIVLAIFSALDAKVDDLTSIGLGVDAALEAKVSITGAFDDACASYFGNFVITDNKTRKILKRTRVNPERYRVLLQIPPTKRYTVNTDVGRLKAVANEVKAVHKIALSGDYFIAMTLNGLLHSAALGYDPKVSTDALANGAIACGLSGKGPSVAAVVPTEKVDEIRRAWGAYEGEIIATEINVQKAHVLR